MPQEKARVLGIQEYVMKPILSGDIAHVIRHLSDEAVSD
jgi:hypothetical protein